MNLSPKGKDGKPIDKEDKRDKEEWIMKRLHDFYEVEEEEWIMSHILSRVGRLFWPLSHSAQNNPDSEYKQYITQRGRASSIVSIAAYSTRG